MRGEFIDVGDVQLYYYAGGSRGVGDPLLLVHGFPTSSLLWAQVVPLIPPGHRVVVPDLLGFGRSTLPAVHAAPIDLSVVGHARRLVQLLDTLRVDRLYAVGHGLGAAVVLALQSLRPQRVTGIGLINAITAGSWPGRASRRARVLLPLLRLLPSSAMLQVLRGRLLQPGGRPAVYARAVDQYLRPFAGRSGQTLLMAHLRALTAAPPPQIAAAQSPAGPIAIMWGEHDPLLSPAQAHRLQASLPGATLDVVAGGHFSPAESPEHVAKVLAHLLEAR